jgi:hypothetical protein
VTTEHDDAALVAWTTKAVGGRVTGVEVVQSLWSGYGRLLRVRLEGAAHPSVIVKHVRPPSDDAHPRGWSGRASHERKLRSYEVERRFYERHNRADRHRTARCLAQAVDAEGSRLMLEDLDAAGFRGRRAQLTEPEVSRCLRWLASFHAAHFGRASDDLWDEGCYWHLATRQRELEAMQDSALRDAAPQLDALLRTARHRTWVHGDAKVANFCFARGDVAAVDFQYVGGGCGVKDVAYFLSSCLDDDQCERRADRHLDRYFEELLPLLPDHVDGDDVAREWRALYPAAWADFHRFLVGWAPDHWKIHRYTRAMTRAALDRL